MTESVLQRNIRESMTVIQALAAFEQPMEAASQVTTKALLSGQKLLACGNGGSSSDAGHLTTEFVCRFNKDRRPYPAICLNAHGGDLTAIGNDYAFEDVFARQVEAFGKPGDVLFAFTTSGKSENVYRALQAAQKQGVTSIAFLGRGGGKCAGVASIEFLIAHEKTARIQEAHQFLFHEICERVDAALQAANQL